MATPEPRPGPTQQPKVGQTRDGAEPVEDGGEAVGVEGFAVAGGEHQSALVPAWTEESPFPVLALPVMVEHREGRVGQGDGALGGGGFGRGEGDAGADQAHKGLADGEGPCVEVDVGPAQAEQFAAAHPGEQGEVDQGVEAVVAGGVQQGFGLVQGECSGLVPVAAGGYLDEGCDDAAAPRPVKASRDGSSAPDCRHRSHRASYARTSGRYGLCAPEFTSKTFQFR